MTTLGRTATLLIGGAFCGSIAPSVCLAQVQLPAVNLGFTNFEDGLAAPGWIVQEFPVFYDANEQKDAHGKTCKLIVNFPSM